MAFERGGQRLVVGAPRRDADEILVGEADEGRFQRRRERQVVVGQERRAARGDEVEHGDVLADVEPVGARDRHAAPPSARGSPPRRPGRACAPARGCRPARRTRPRSSPSAVQHLIACATRRGDDDRRRAPFRLVDGRVQASGSGSSAGRSTGHNSTRPGASGRALVCTVPIAVVLEGQAAEMLARPRMWRRPPRAPPAPSGTRASGARPRMRSSTALARSAPPAPAHLELARGGALEAVDRLLGIADREQRADPLAARAAPAVKSAVMRRRISHCSGLVSCASSTGRGRCRGRACRAPRPPSPRRSSASVFSIRSSKSSAPSRALRRSTRRLISPASVNKAPVRSMRARGLRRSSRAGEARLLGEHVLLERRIDGFGDDSVSRLAARPRPAREEDGKIVAEVSGRDRPPQWRPANSRPGPRRRIFRCWSAAAIAGQSRGGDPSSIIARSMAAGVSPAKKPERGPEPIERAGEAARMLEKSLVPHRRGDRRRERLAGSL